MRIASSSDEAVGVRDGSATPAVVFPSIGPNILSSDPASAAETH